MSRPSSTDPDRPSARKAKRGGSKRRRSKPQSTGGRILHLEPFSGIAGNMFMAALLDLGLSRRELEADLAGLGVDFKLKVSRVTRGALAARYVEVAVPTAAKAKPKAKSTKHHHYHAPHTHGRSYAQIRALLEAARLEVPVRETASSIFHALAVAEARVHGVKVDDVHFHEVGAVDAIVDITAAAIGLHRLEIRGVTCSPLALGDGVVDTAHGRLPLPAPATLELLKGIPTVPAHVSWETVTPTGAAIAAVVVEEFRTLPAMVVEAVGYGAGKDREGPMPNVLRVVSGRDNALESDRICVIETNLDDLIPEHFDYLMEKLFEAGALDVSLQNIQMKKNRPGFAIRALARPSDRQSIAQLMLAESTAIGVRTSEWDRVLLEREQHEVDTPFGPIGIKLVRGVDGSASVSAEYDDCKRAARDSEAPLREVVAAAERLAREELL